MKKDTEFFGGAFFTNWSHFRYLYRSGRIEYSCYEIYEHFVITI